MRGAAMSDKERWVSLEQAASFASGGTPSKANPDYWIGTIPWVSAKDMKSSRISDTEDHISEVGLANGSRLAPAGATLVLARGMTLLNDVPICLATRDVAFNQDVKALVAKDGVVSAYLNYAIHAAKPSLLSAVDLAGHGTGKLPTDVFKSVRIRLPDEDEQRAIARILGTIDDKIELNRRTNETLEAMARAIFKSWFVDFDPVRAKASGEPPESICRRLGLTPDRLALFPDNFQESELGEIPSGWSVMPLVALTEKISKGTTPTKQDIATATDVPAIPFIKVKDISDQGEIGRTNLEKIPDSVHRGKLKRSILEVGDILFSIAGTIGRAAVVDPDLANANTNQAVAFVRLRDKAAHLGLCLQYLKSDRVMEAANASVVQAVQANVSLASLGAFKVVLPSSDILEFWNQTSYALFDKTKNCVAEIRALVAIRDALLPRLLSGDMEVDEASREMEVVATC